MKFCAFKSLKSEQKICITDTMKLRPKVICRRGNEYGEVVDLNDSQFNNSFDFEQ